MVASENQSIKGDYLISILEVTMVPAGGCLFASLVLSVVVSAATSYNNIGTYPPAHLNEVGTSEPEPDFGDVIKNVTVALGREAVLSCIVDNLGDYKVGWLRTDTQTILSLHKKVVTHNTRISVTHSEPRTWNLHIRAVKEEDRGCYMCQINTSVMKKTVGCVDVHVPPNIIDEETSGDIEVRDGDSVSLVCTARGYPEPKILWRREDNEKIMLRQGRGNKSKVDEVEGRFLNLTRVRRKQMGAYRCIAMNEVPPAVMKRILVKVSFEPTIHVPNQLVATPLGKDLRLSCHVEAFPKPITFWRINNDIMIINGWRSLPGRTTPTCLFSYGTWRRRTSAFTPASRETLLVRPRGRSAPMRSILRCPPPTAPPLTEVLQVVISSPTPLIIVPSLQVCTKTTWTRNTTNTR
ncbi:lachesin-like isoform X2 [Portunus trituberculatus]|uniref:lachesin-like isoform X2 n=1 Tax=Portunus trituberculatus TaxID=210409 RepID=UPI001E1CB2FF|nr:lachesin-like isoform X2 [Portunus trituberculatus]